MRSASKRSGRTAEESPAGAAVEKRTAAAVRSPEKPSEGGTPMNACSGCMGGDLRDPPPELDKRVVEKGDRCAE